MVESDNIGSKSHFDISRAGTNREPLISIITPVFNGARYIEGCVESVLVQTYPRVEHVVQDGASQDGTVDILRRYDGRISWVSEPDRGQAEGLDRALKRSKGDYLLVLNADDELLPDAAAWAAQQMARFPRAAVVYGDVLLVDEDGEEIAEFKGPEYDFEAVFCVERVIPAQAAFIRRSALEKVGLGADPTLDTCPDYEMFVRLGLEFPMRHVPGLITRYRYYAREWDGSQRRTVQRFVAAKSQVMERVFEDPEVPPAIKRLESRARVGLLLWAATEARTIGDLGEGWRFYARALRATSPLLAPLAWLIHAALRVRGMMVRPDRTALSRRQVTPSHYLQVGSGLLSDSLDASPSFAAGRRVSSMLFGPLLRAVWRLGRMAFWLLVFAALAYLLYLGSLEFLQQWGGS